MNRNVVTLSHLDPELHDWLKEEAQRRTQNTGVRVHAWQLANTAIREYRGRSDHDKEPQEVSHVAHR